MSYYPLACLVQKSRISSSSSLPLPRKALDSLTGLDYCPRSCFTTDMKLGFLLIRFLLHCRRVIQPSLPILERKAAKFWSLGELDKVRAFSSQQWSEYRHQFATELFYQTITPFFGDKLVYAFQLVATPRDCIKKGPHDAIRYAGLELLFNSQTALLHNLKSNRARKW